MNKNFWPVVEAQKIVSLLRKDQDTVVFETGYGPSGLPHIGTFAEVARANFVISALKKIAPHLKTKLIAFSDDRDGLRKIAKNLPNQSMLKEHLGKPLSKVPDPFGKEPSFAHYMNKKLRYFLDSFGFKYEYISATDFYQKGNMDIALMRVADQYEIIRNIFIKTISAEKRPDWSPFFPICENCGKMYSTKVLNINTKKYTLEYECTINSDSVNACKHKGEIPITGSNIKLGWKVDWAARWYTLDVDYELHGEDLMDSVKVSKNICKAIGKPGPQTFKYELFLDEMGLKISKTKGNGLTMEDWLRYSPINALLFFILGDPGKPKKMGLSIIPRLVDEYINAEKKEISLDIENPIWYIGEFKKYNRQAIQAFLPYQLLANIASSLGADNADLLVEYSEKYQPGISQNKEFVDFCKKVILFNQEHNKYNAAPLKLDEKYCIPFKKWHAYLNNIPTDQISGDEIQKQIFSIAKEADLNMKDWFKFLYTAYLNKTEGPKLGQYFALLGKLKSLDLTERIIKTQKWVN